MNKLTMLSAVLLSAASLSLSAGAFAESNYSADEAMRSTTDTAKRVGNSIKDTGIGVAGALKGMAKDSNEALKSAGNKTKDMVTGNKKQ